MCCDVFVFTCILNPLCSLLFIEPLPCYTRTLLSGGKSIFLSSFFFLLLVVLTLRIVTFSRTEPRMLLLQRHCIHSSSTLVRSNEGVFAIKCSHLFPSYLGGNESLWPIKPFDSSKICLQFCIKPLPLLHA